MKNMWVKYQNAIVEILQGIIDLSKVDEKIDVDTDLKSMGMDSLSFVRVVVEIENHFNIEFPEENLDIVQAGTIRKLCETIAEMKD